ncbi:glycoside hydrolase family 16 protein [Opitutaceae bacterium TAV4]|nr:glycoside hydrolase family 16 protein [Opitutaceae bacterium TAV4]RRK00134.1 glycoside hydrolase family 16 protein [Opitutaceae bacterium TAV3]
MNATLTLRVFLPALASASLALTPLAFAQSEAPPTSAPTNDAAPSTPAPATRPTTARPPNVTTVEAFKTLAYDITQRGRPLDLSDYRQTFLDDFDTMSISPPGGAEANWYGPVHGGAGAAKWIPPGPDGPFSVKDGHLTITTKKDASGKWTTGIIETADRNGRGFSQQYGYFEMRAKFPPDKAVWPSFWLKAAAERTDRTMSRPEIDIIEWYGSEDARGHHSSVHLWAATRNRDPDYPLKKHVWRSHYFDLRKLTPPVMTPFEGERWGRLEGFHTYGAEITPEWVIFHFDRKEISRFPMLPEYHQPLFMIVCLALKKTDTPDNPKEMVIDYVTAYQKNKY